LKQCSRFTTRKHPNCTIFDHFYNMSSSISTTIQSTMMAIAPFDQE
jgi:hypothetical protein